MRVAAVVVTYNRKEMLVQCLRHIAAQQGASCDILVVDNASTDNTGEAIRAPGMPEVHYLRAESNLGGAGGFRFGMKQAVEMGYEYLWLMDDDTLPAEDALRRFLEADADLGGRYGFLSGKAVWHDGSPAKMNRQKKNLLADVPPDADGLTPVVLATFVSLFLRRETVLAFGYPLASFFICTDDWEYTRRISRNITGYYVPQSVALHAMRQNIASDVTNDTPDRFYRYRYSYRNEVYFFRREGATGWLMMLAKYVYHSLRALLFARNHRWKRVGIIWKGFWEGLRFHPGAEV